MSVIVFDVERACEKQKDDAKQPQQPPAPAEKGSSIESAGPYESLGEGKQEPLKK